VPVPQFLPIAALLAAAILIAGCGGNDDAGGGVGTDATVGQAPPEPDKGATHELEIPEDDPAGSEKLTTEPITGGYQGINYKAYDSAIGDILFLLDEYWAATLPQTFGAEYVPPTDVIAYYPNEDDPGCGGQALGGGNASYCFSDDTVAWDEPGLMVPFYVEVGDMAMGFVLAHEWGHLIQDRLVLKFPLTIESELNADCFAGDFAGGLADEGLLVGGTGLKPGTDLAEATDAIFAVGDHPSVEWQDPQAHGTGEERLDAFATGFDEGAQACLDVYGPGFSKTG
jgi:predicted metalloprotease